MGENDFADIIYHTPYLPHIMKKVPSWHSFYIAKTIIYTLNHSLDL